MPAYLFIQEGPNSGEVHALGAEARVVGRGEDCSLRLGDPFVSRRHFEIEEKDGEHILKDLGSRNKTVVNGAPTSRRVLRSGDEIRIGDTRLVYIPLASGQRAPEDARAVAQTVTRMISEHTRAAAPPEILGDGKEIRRVFAAIEKAAPLDVTVLVTGESGTGKELVARALHRASPRAGGPLVTVNCAAIPKELVESELFGHEKGAFTGAQAQRLGKFELAQGGTVFLDEIGELPPDGQAKLLRVLEDRKVVRVGAQKEVKLDVRIIAATNRDLHALAREGRFREDLIYRLEVVTIELPPLRARRDDVAAIARHFLLHFAEKIGKPPMSFSGEALAALVAHDWPGNVRELRNVVERAAIFGAGTVIGPEDLQLGRGTPPAAAPIAPPPAPGGVAPIDAVVKDQIVRALAAAGGNKKKAAAMLGIPRSSLYNYIAKFGIAAE